MKKKKQKNKKRTAKRPQKKAKTKPKKQKKRQKISRKAPKAKPQKEKQVSSVSLFEETIIQCANCGKKMKLLKAPEFDPSGMLCQSCSKGEIEPIN